MSRGLVLGAKILPVIALTAAVSLPDKTVGLLESYKQAFQTLFNYPEFQNDTSQDQEISQGTSIVVENDTSFSSDILQIAQEDPTFAEPDIGIIEHNSPVNQEPVNNNPEVSAEPIRNFPSSEELISRHNNIVLRCEGTRNNRNITCYPNSSNGISYFPSSSRNRVNGRWYQSGGSYKWYEDGVLLSRSQVNFILRMGYNQSQGSIRRFVQDSLVEVDFFNETYRVNSILASKLHEAEEILTNSGVRYIIGNLARGEGFQWRPATGANRNLSNHGLGTAVDIDPGYNCWQNRDRCAGRRPIVPVYMYTNVVFPNSIQTSACSDDINSVNGVRTAYCAPSETTFIETMWNLNLRTPMEWAASNRGGGVRLSGQSNLTFNRMYTTYLGNPHDNVSTNEERLIADWMHFDLAIDQSGRVRSRDLNRSGESYSIYH